MSTRKASQSYLMALDAGTGAGRCFLVSTDGKHTVEAYQEWAYDFPAEAQPGGSQFDAEKFWGIFSRLIREALHKGKFSPQQIRGISSTSQREGIVLLDKAGRELYAGPNVDMRRPSDAAEFTKQNAELLHSISGHWPFPMFAPYRLLWFKEHHPEIFEQVDKMLLLNDWILYRLCGHFGSEPTNGNETLLLDLRTRNWSTEVIEKLGFPKGIFPPILEPGTVLGEVTQKVAEETGLAIRTPVVIGGADTQCAMLGMGAVQPGDTGIALGTYGPQQMVLDRPVISDPEYAWSGCHILPDRWVLESSIMEAGQAFRWVRDSFYASESGETYSQMEADAAASKPGAGGIQSFIGPRLPNYLELKFAGPGGFRMQLPPAPGTNTRGDFARATLESVAFAIRANTERLKRVSGQDLAGLHTCGGLTKSKTLLQVTATLFESPVKVLQAKEGTALGAAICAGVGSGEFADFAQGIQSLSSSNSVDPNPQDIEFYKEAYQQWLRQAPAMYGLDGAME